jgi:diguanylate cyclase (GGDEF)-like protein
MQHDLAAENRLLRNQLAQLLRQAQENDEILRRYQSFDLQFISASTFQELIDTVFDRFARAADLDVVTLALLDPDYEIRRMLVDLNIRFSELPNLLFLQDESELGELADRLSAPELGPYAEQTDGVLFPEPLAAPVSVAIAPLLRHERLIGCLNLGSSDATRFTPEMATDFISHMASIVAICFENVINNERLKHIGLTDPLTGVNNRRYIERRLREEIGRSRRQGYGLSCMYVDIDHFKQINDRIGHQAGDEVLREVAGRIKAELRLSDALGRFGGEEFVVLLIDTELPEASIVAERIRQGVAEPAVVLSDGTSLNVTVSIGVAALGMEAAGESVDGAAQGFVARADHALYAAKQNGRNRVVAAD